MVNGFYKGFTTRTYKPNGDREVARRLRQIRDCQLQVTPDPEKDKDINPFRPPVENNGEEYEFT